MPVEPRRKRSKMAWYSPDPRGIIPIDGLHVTRSMRKSARRFEIRHRHGVHRGDAPVRRPDAARALDHRRDRDGLRRAVRAGLGALDRGLARRSPRRRASTACAIDRLFAGESMFHLETDASKVALMALVDWLQQLGVALFDVQWTTPHLASLGAIDVPRPEVPATARRCGRSTGNVRPRRRAIGTARNGRPTIPCVPGMAARPSLGTRRPGWPPDHPMRIQGGRSAHRPP